MREFVLKGLYVGIVAGIVLGFFFKVMEAYFHIKVYTLLLNIDYISYLNQIKFPEWVEFTFHLVVSVIISIMILYAILKFNWTKKQIIYYPILISFLIGVLLYPTTALSDRTPPITSGSAILIWLIGHVLYGGVLSAYFIKWALKGPGPL